MFVIEHMSKTPTFADRFALLDYSLASVDPKLEGLYCEFGVFTGTTINHVASRVKQPVHGFDSFEGLPEDSRTDYGKGTFAMSGLPKVRENVRLHKGWFNESLPLWSAANPGPIAFMHMDADLYSATKTVFDLLGERIVPGTIIQFDEFFNYPDWQNGEFKAFMQFVAYHNISYEYIGYYNKNQQVAFRILRVPSRG